LSIRRVTTFYCEVPGDIYKVSRVVDPLGRQATFSYNGSGKLVTITDAIGMQ
jgi:YD repeat-containing protein